MLDTWLGQNCGPVSNQRCGDAAFVYPMLEEAKGRVGDIRPWEIVAHIGERTAWLHVEPIAHLNLAAIIGGIGHKLGPTILSHEFCTAAVVRKEED